MRDGAVVMREATRIGRLGDADFREASGVVRSALDTGVFWGHNDSGNDPQLFAFESSGRVVASPRVRGVDNVDWEAMATGPCPEGSCLFIGDIGDNFAVRASVSIHRLPVPTTDVRTVAIGRTLVVRYADGPHDIEAMYAGPDSSLWLVTKRPARGRGGEARPSRVYHIPAAAWGDGAAYTAAVVDSVPVTPGKGTHDWITDASLSELLPDGTRRVVLLSYGAVHVLQADPHTGRPGALIARCALPIREKSAEGVSWLPDGRILVVNEGKSAPLYTGRCP